VKRVAVVVALFVLSFAAAAGPAHAQRQRLSMDPGWRFALGDHPGAEKPAFDDAQWRRLDLPHDWSIEGTPAKDAPAGGNGGYFPTGIGWYRKAFRLPEGARGHDVSLEFDGIYMNGEVWVNGARLGKRPYGYTSVAYDITSHLVPGVNVVAVRADNSAQQNSRWYSGSGIYRHTWLTITDRLRVARWGTYVTTPRADAAGADVVVRTRIENRGALVKHGVLRSTIVSGDGKDVAFAESPFSLGNALDDEIEQTLHVAAPLLWSVEHANLYTLRTELLDGARATDRVATPFGIRRIAYDKDQGFLLNGTRVKMNGVNLHGDAGAVGTAVPERVWERRLVALKAMGVNAIRTSHNPPAPEFLDLCDKLGLLVMAEAFDEWTFGKVPEGYHKYFAEWSERDVTDFVHRDRNHPSIVLWSAGNEIGEQTSPTGADVLRRLVGFFHREDPTRPVTTGNDHIFADDGATPASFLSAEDVVGYNYVDRWHERREIFAEPDRHAHPEWKMIGTESSPAFNTFDGRYSLGADATRVTPNYTTGMVQAERLWKWVAMHDYFAGDFMWTGVDYLGETVWPGLGFLSGSLDIIGRPKDSYYFYQSVWTSAPVLHLFPHWNWPGREGQMIPVLAYTNCNSVELFLNGKSLGEKVLEFPAQGTTGGWNSYALPVVAATTNDLHLSWDVPYAPGTLRAVGKKRGGAPCGADEVRTAGAPAAIRLVADRDSVSTSAGDVSHVNVEIVDANGIVVPTASDRVRFAVRGGTIVALDNGDLFDHDPYRASDRRAFNGRGLALLRASQPGTLTLTATADGLTPATVTVKVVRGADAPVIPAAR